MWTTSFLRPSTDAVHHGAKTAVLEHPARFAVDAVVHFQDKYSHSLFSLGLAVASRAIALARRKEKVRFARRLAQHGREYIRVVAAGLGTKFSDGNL